MARARASSAKKKGGRGLYSAALTKRICDRLANGESLRSICEDGGMPDERTVRRWALDAAHPFAPQYAHAREVGYNRIADELLDIADDARNDWMDRQTRNGPIRAVDEECVRRSQLRVDTRKWLLAKALPKVYGDKIEHTLDGAAAFVELWNAIGRGRAAV